MALDINGLRFLVKMHKEGIHFDKVLTLGRLNLNIYPRTIWQTLRQSGIPVPLELYELHPQDYAEPVFKAFGAKSVTALDASSYEGAGLVHDLNVPLPSWCDTFDLVWDGGTLEHVFNFPVAIRNCLNLLKVGGHLVINTPCNNTMGHGFYQFSPELFFRVLDHASGVLLKQLIIFRTGPFNRWYEVQDPCEVGERVELISLTPMQLLILAQKQVHGKFLRFSPSQSDFTHPWSTKKANRLTPIDLIAGRYPRLARLLNVVLMGLLFYRKYSLGNRRFYKPIPKL